ncbi:MAG: glycosyltransferase family 39 protein [Longimicrobiaceae bacterium]
MTGASLAVPAEYVPLAAGLLLVAWAFAWRALPSLPAAVEPWLRRRAAPRVAGAVTALLTWAIFGSLRAVPVFHDEAAYLLQARIFASGRWTAPAPPLPEFFEQFHVLVTPVMASKYPPGHSLLMAPGALLGLPGLVPVLLAGLAGGLLYALARRAAGGWVALLAWLLWLAQPAALAWRAGYFSENTSGACILLALWLWLRWRDTGRAGWLVAVAAAVGWGAITRPLTLLGFAVPLGVATLAAVHRRRAWGSLAAALLAGVATLSLYALCSRQTTGDWLLTPHQLYTRTYMGYDHVGFGMTMPPTGRALPPDIAAVNDGYERGHRSHVPSALPVIAAQRLGMLAGDVGRWDALILPALPELADGAMWVLVALTVWGAFTRTGEARFTVAALASLFGAYLFYGHPPGWTVYYVESHPGFAFLCALGIRRAAGALAGWRKADVERWAARGVALAAGVAAIAAAGGVLVVRAEAARRRRYPEAFAALVRQLPEPRALVFVRYAPGHSPHQSVIQNSPDVDTARAVFVYDRGADDARLIRAMPGRAPYLFDEAAGRIRPLTPADLARPVPAWHPAGSPR